MCALAGRIHFWGLPGHILGIRHEEERYFIPPPWGVMILLHFLCMLTDQRRPRAVDESSDRQTGMFGISRRSRLQLGKRR